MELTFEQLPKAVTQLQKTLNNVERLLLEKSNEHLQQEPDRWFDLNELVEYDPEKRTKPTWYGYVHRMEIPFHKRGKKLTFLKSEIDNWLKQGRRKTASEIDAEAEMFLSDNKKK